MKKIQNNITTKLMEKVNNTHNITIPNLVIDLGNTKLMFDKPEITANELVDVYMKLESFIKLNFTHIHL